MHCNEFSNDINLFSNTTKEKYLTSQVQENKMAQNNKQTLVYVGVKRGRPNVWYFCILNSKHPICIKDF